MKPLEILFFAVLPVLVNAAIAAVCLLIVWIVQKLKHDPD